MLLISSDRRPLRGVAGLVDWRLCGELSAALQSGTLHGQVGERLLMSTRQRLGASRLLLFGAGPASRPLGAPELSALLEAARASGAERLAVEVPDSAPVDAVAEALRAFRGKHLTVLGASTALAERFGKVGRTS